MKFLPADEQLAILERGNPCVLSVQQDQHWASAVGSLGERVLIADSARGEVVVSMEKDELREYWRSNHNRYYLIEIQCIE